MLIFILQTVWLYIKELAGKDLDPIIIAKFLAYFMPKLIPLVLPLTILLSSIMVFGSFAENYEFAAMKSTGISLQRAMTGLSLFIVLLGVTTFFFSNNVIPWAEYNSLNLRINIKNTKPSAAIAEGQFNPIGNNFNIKVSEKSGDNDRLLKDVVIHIKTPNGKNTKTIVANNGELKNKKDSDILQLILFDGNYYEDIIPKSLKSRNKKPFAKSTFEKYIMNIDLSDFNNVDFDEKSQTDKYSMLDVVGLDKMMDSLIDKQQKDQKSVARNLFQRSSFAKYGKKTDLETENDSVFKGNILDILDTKKKSKLIDDALRAITSSKQVLTQRIAAYKITKTTFNKHIISFHEKFALAIACIILFFVGAPLGALIRKGGIGLPMVIAILLFLSYHFIGIFATNSAKNGEFNPVLASWFSTLVMLPLGIYLTKRATADRGLFEVGNIIEPLKKALNIKLADNVDYKFLASYKKDELVDVIKNYDTLGHDEAVRFESIKTLKQRGISIEELSKTELEINEDYITSEKIISNYKKQSKLALILYIVGVFLLILFFVFKNNKLPSLASISIKVSIVSFSIYIFYYIKSIMSSFKFYEHINKKEKQKSIIYIILGFPLYMFVYPFFSIKIKEDLKQNCLDSLK